MKCDSYLSLISAHLDGETTETEEQRLREHLRNCVRCQTRLTQFAKADAQLRSLRPLPPIDLRDRILREVRKDPRAKNGHKRISRVAAFSSLAAALLAFAILGNLKLPGFSSKNATNNQALTTQDSCGNDALPLYGENLSGNGSPDAAAPSDILSASASEAPDRTDTFGATTSTKSFAEQYLFGKSTEKTDTALSGASYFRSPTEAMEEQPTLLLLRNVSSAQLCSLSPLLDGADSLSASEEANFAARAFAAYPLAARLTMPQKASAYIVSSDALYAIYDACTASCEATVLHAQSTSELCYVLIVENPNEITE